MTKTKAATATQSSTKPIAARALRKAAMHPAPITSLLDRLDLGDQPLGNDVLAFEAREHRPGDVEPGLLRRNDDRHAVLVLRLGVVGRDLGGGELEVLLAGLPGGFLEDLPLLGIELVPGALAHDR